LSFDVTFQTDGGIFPVVIASRPAPCGFMKNNAYEQAAEGKYADA
jgi:hypothetical protein